MIVIIVSRWIQFLARNTRRLFRLDSSSPVEMWCKRRKTTVSKTKLPLLINCARRQPRRIWFEKVNYLLLIIMINIVVCLWYLLTLGEGWYIICTNWYQIMIKTYVNVNKIFHFYKVIFFDSSWKHFKPIFQITGILVHYSIQFSSFNVY